MKANYKNDQAIRVIKNEIANDRSDGASIRNFVARLVGHVTKYTSYE